MSIHFMHGRLDMPVEATPTASGAWDVIITPERTPIEIPADQFARDFPTIPEQTEFHRWTRDGYSSPLDIRTELETHDLQIVSSDEDRDGLPHDAWILLINSAMHPRDMPEMLSGWANGELRPVKFWPLVALVPKN